MEKRSLLTRLREFSCGKDVWRVQDKDTKAYCIEFEAREGPEAEQWWHDHKQRDFHKNHELALVRVYSFDDRMMREAADALELHAKASDVLPRLLEIKCRIAKQDGEWHIFERDGNGVAHGATFLEMLEALQHVDVEEYERQYLERCRNFMERTGKADSLGW